MKAKCLKLQYSFTFFYMIFKFSSYSLHVHPYMIFNFNPFHKPLKILLKLTLLFRFKFKISVLMVTVFNHRITGKVLKKTNFAFSFLTQKRKFIGSSLLKVRNLVTLSCQSETESILKEYASISILYWLSLSFFFKYQPQQLRE